jgi:hypothetical protein
MNKKRMTRPLTTAILDDLKRGDVITLRGGRQLTYYPSMCTGGTGWNRRFTVDRIVSNTIIRNLRFAGSDIQSVQRISGNQWSRDAILIGEVSDWVEQQSHGLTLSPPCFEEGECQSK